MSVNDEEILQGGGPEVGRRCTQRGNTNRREALGKLLEGAGDKVVEMYGDAFFSVAL